jgi:hypothetical protein
VHFRSLRDPIDTAGHVFPPGPRRRGAA